MPTKRKRITRKIVETELSPTQLCVVSDGLLIEGEVDFFESFILEDNPARLQELWEGNKRRILAAWIRQRPGTRPTLWWRFDAQRMSRIELQKNRWDGCDFTDQLAEPRRRMGGTGTAAHDCLNQTPSFVCGIPDSWITREYVEIFGSSFRGVALDPFNPPVFESQADYLRRHDLFLQGEEQRLRPADFEPETVSTPESETTETIQ